MKRGLDKSKFKVSLKPVNMAVIVYIQKNKIATTKEIIAHHQEYSQASIYRAIHELLDSNIISIAKEEKVHSVLERYFRLNYDVSSELNDYITQEQYDDIVNAVNIWMSTVTQEIHEYLQDWSQTTDAIRFGMGREMLHVRDEDFVAFYKEMQALIRKYQSIPPRGDEKTLAFSASWVPIKKGQG